MSIVAITFFKKYFEMIQVWLNRDFLQFNLLRLYSKPFPPFIPLERLTVGDTIDTDDLETAFAQAQDVDNYRSLSVGDLLQRSDNTCWYVDLQGFLPSQQTLLHVAVIHDPEVGDMYEAFPTLDLDLAQSKVISVFDLSWSRFSYIQTRQWHNGTTRQLLRFYK